MDPNSIGRRTNKLGFLDWLVILDGKLDKQEMKRCEKEAMDALARISHELFGLSL